MIPILGLAAAAVHALTVGEACVLGATIGSASTIALNAFSKKGSEQKARNDKESLDDATMDEVLRLAERIIKRRRMKEDT